MANEHLENLATSGNLKAEPATADEVSGLVRSGTARLADAKNGGLSLESRFDLAYNAAHALSLAGLRIAGYPRTIATWCSSASGIPLAFRTRIGACSTRPIADAISRNTRALPMSKKA